MTIKILRENLVYFFSIIILIILFAIIKNTNIYNYILNLDYTVIDFMKNITNDKLTTFFKFITFFGDWYIPFIIILLSFIISKNIKYTYILGINYIFFGIVSILSKNIIFRPRPLEALIKIPSSYSFPSGHTLTSIGFYIILWYILTYNKTKKVKYLFFSLFFILIFLIGLSRIYLGIHYFSDVIGAVIISIPCLFIALNLIDKYLKEK